MGSEGTIARRKWIKLYPMECLTGSIRYQLTAEERGTWYDLLNFASISSNTGFIGDRDGRPYPHSYIANRLNINVELLESTLSKCKAEGRLSEDEHGVQITKWETYQSEYDRQKPYQLKYYQKQKSQEKLTNARWDAMPDDYKAKAIAHFGDPETWDEYTWIAVTGKLPGEWAKEADPENKLDL